MRESRIFIKIGMSGPPREFSTLWIYSPGESLRTYYRTRPAPPTSKTSTPAMLPPPTHPRRLPSPPLPSSLHSIIPSPRHPYAKRRLHPHSYPYNPNLVLIPTPTPTIHSPQTAKSTPLPPPRFPTIPLFHPTQNLNLPPASHPFYQTPQHLLLLHFHHTKYQLQ